MFVVDTSVTMAWCFDEQATEETRQLLGRLNTEDALAPSIWPLEVSNVLLTAERRGRISEAATTRFLSLLDQLPITVDLVPVAMGEVVAAGRRHGLSGYDAAYLNLAEREGLALATLDKKLADAARRAGIVLSLL